MSPPVVLVEHDPKLPVVELVLATRTGSMYDPSGREGALNLALKTLTRGAGALSGDRLEEHLDRLGAEFSAGAEVTTTHIHATVLRRNLEAFTALLRDLVARPLFEPEEVSRRARALRADIVDSRDDDRTLAGRHFRRGLFRGHPSGRPVAGTPSTLPTLAAVDVRSAYTHAFTRGNVVCGASGAITEVEARALFGCVLEALPEGAAPSGALPDPQPLRGRELLVVDKPDRTQVQLLIGCLGTRADDPDHVPLAVGNAIFGGTFTARLMREVRSKRGWSYGATSRLYRDRARDAWSMWTFPAVTDAPACIALQLQLLERWVAEGITARELSQAKQFLIRGRAFDFETPSRRLSHRMDEAIHGLPEGYHRTYADRVAKVTVEQVNRAVRRRITPRDLLVVAVCTASASLEALKGVIPGLSRVTVVPFDTD
ncbi:MAG: insulinase family protein [Deltaproteobacteria bacterium]|nr:insulinase family protein [Deltaproteobacteria bacterium]